MFTKKLRGRYRLLIGPLAAHVHSLPHNYQCTYQKCAFLTGDEPTLVYVIIQSPQFTLGFSIGVVHSVGLGQLYDNIHYYSIIENIFTPLKTSVLCQLISLPSLSL